jgi:hypothetical protein
MGEWGQIQKWIGFHTGSNPLKKKLTLDEEQSYFGEIYLLSFSLFIITYPCVKLHQPRYFSKIFSECGYGFFRKFLYRNLDPIIQAIKFL